MASKVPMDDTTCFVRNIAFSVTDAKLTELFSDVGPVKKAFLVREKGSDKHKGYGFVTFATKEDAARAATKMGGKNEEGRALQVEVAKKRDGLESRNSKRQAKGERPFQPKPRGKVIDKISVDDVTDGVAEEAPEEPAYVYTAPVQTPVGKRMTAFDKAELCKSLAIGNIPPGCVDKVTRKARALGSVKHIDDPAPGHIEAFGKLRQDGCEGHTIIVKYANGKDAFHAVWKLHGKEFEGGKLWARQLNGEGAQVKKWRVILRNLPFGVTEDELKGVFSKVGFVWSVSIPKMDSGKMKGFAFISFTCRAHAERAILAVNGKDYKGRVVVADWSLARAAYKDKDVAPAVPEAHHGDTYGHDDLEPSTVKQTAPEPASVREDGDEDDNEEEDVEEDDDAMEIDDKEEDVEEGAMEVTPAERNLLSRVLGSVAGKDDAVAVVTKKGKKEASVVEKSEVKVEKSEAELEASAEWEGPRSRAEGEGASTSGRGSGEIKTQVFVRNLPNECTVIQLSTRLARFGSVKACRLVMNKATSKPKGTAFVEFDAPEGALKAVAASKAYADGTGPGLSLKDKHLIIDAALVQESARSLAAFGSVKSSTGNDKRNLYLAKEGVIEEDTTLWESLSTNDQNRRHGAAAERKLKLKSPNFFVSPTRLHIMNVPQSWDEKALKESCRKAILERATKARPKIKQVIVLRDKTRLDDDGEMKSRGLAFVEFESHEDALVCLRQMNNNPNLFGGVTKRPIVEFAIESVKILKIRDRKIRLQQELVAERAAAEPGEAPKVGDEEAERIRLRGLKRKERNDRRKRERYEKERFGGPRGEAENQHYPEDGYEGEEVEPQAKKKRVRRKDRVEDDEVMAVQLEQAAMYDDVVQTENVKKKSRRKSGGIAEVAQGARDAFPEEEAKGSARSDKGNGIQEAPQERKGKKGRAAKRVDNRQAEEKHQKQQRGVDDAVDALASSGGGGPGPQPKRKHKKPDTDKTDDLITKRTRALFGLGAKGPDSGASGAGGGINSRWFAT